MVRKCEHNLYFINAPDVMVLYVAFMYHNLWAAFLMWSHITDSNPPGVRAMINDWIISLVPDTLCLSPIWTHFRSIHRVLFCSDTVCNCNKLQF